MLGKITLDIPPSPGNPRNSEGAMLRRKDGSILFVYSHFPGSEAADDSTADLHAMVSNDEGEHFSPLGLVVSHEETQAKNVMSVSLLRMEDGSIGLFYLERKSESDMRMILRRSADEGRTWSQPSVCMPYPGHYVVNNDRIVRLASGRIYLPCALHRRVVCDDGSVYFDSRSLDYNGQTYDPPYKIVVLVGGARQGKGSGSSKKEAEAAAARDALERLGYTKDGVIAQQKRK